MFKESRKRLIVNADGYGFGLGATEGIIDAIREGQFITSVSVNANFSEAERVCELASAYPSLSIGVHLNPLVGKPCLPPQQVPSLVGSDGFFHGKNFLRLLRKGQVSARELEAEFDAQISKVKKLIGERLTHLDSQANSHLHYFDLFLALARKWRLLRIRNNASLICLEAVRPQLSRVRTYLLKPHVWIAHQYRKIQMKKARAAGIRMADRLITIGYASTGNKTSFDNWFRILKNLPVGTYEIYCHPAYPDDTLRRWASYCDERAHELAILRSGGLRKIAHTFGVDLISFHAI
jgi:predicted glycoside hydrolase/deacetylase ChbG (UPF0249 family)